MCVLRGTPGILSPSAQKYVGFQLRRRERMVTIFLCLASYSASQLRGTTSLRNQSAAFPSPHLTLARALAQATTLERAGAFYSWILGVMFQENLLLMGVDYLKPIGSAYKGASGFGKALHFQNTEPCASRVQTRAV